MHRVTLRSAIREVLAGVVVGEISDTSLNRAIALVVADFDRVMPREVTDERTLRVEVKSESFTTAGAHGTYVNLANKPIEYNSETVKNNAETVTYTRDTDYTIDYSAGKITTISGGGMALSTAHKITYKKSRISVDISGLTDLISVVRVEVPLRMPQIITGFYTWGDYLYVTSTPGSQAPWSDKDHFRIYYHGTYTAPTDTASGNYPRWMDEVMIRGAVAYAWLIEWADSMITTSSRTPVTIWNSGVYVGARDQNADRISASTAIGGLTAATTGVYQKIQDALDALRTVTSGPFARIDTALAALIAAGGPHTKIQTALDAIIAAGGPQAKMGTAIDALAIVTTGPQDKLKAALDALTVVTTGPLAKVTTELDKIPARMTAAEASLAKIGPILDKAYDDSPEGGDLKTAKDTWTDGIAAGTANAHGDEDYLNKAAAATPAGASIDQAAQEYLELGDDRINTVNLGEQAGQLYNQYALAEIQIAEHIASWRRDLVTIGRAKIDITSNHLQEALAELQQVDLYVRDSAGWADKARLYIEEAQSWAAKGQLYLSESAEWFRKGQLYTEEVVGYVRKAEIYLSETREWLGKADRYLAEAQQYFQKGQLYILETGQWLDMARQKGENARLLFDEMGFWVTWSDRIEARWREQHALYIQMLNDRVGQARKQSMTAARQYATELTIVTAPKGA